MRRKPIGNRIAVLAVATATIATLGTFTVSDGVYEPVAPDIVNTGIEIPVVTPSVNEDGILTAEDLAVLNEPTEPEEPEKPKTYAEIPLGEERQLLLFSICEEYSVPAEIALAVIQTESTFDNSARNGSCHGYMQVSTINRTWLNSDIGITDLTDPDQNLRAGCYMLSVLYGKYGDWHKALVCYNCGEGGAYENFFSHGYYTSSYSRLVMQRAESWKEVLK